MSNKKVAGASSSKASETREQDAPATLTPKLRFPEFRDAAAWGIKQFDDLFTIGSGRDYKHLSSGDIPVYGSGGYMLSVDEYLYDGESVCIGRKGTINKPMFLVGKFWTVDTLFYTHSFKECLPKFVFSMFQNIDWLKHNEAGGVPNLSKVNIEKIEVAVPAIPEQQKIADCLTSLDEVIAAQRQKLAALKTHKKGLMQQLFPREGETRPRLRFPEFRDAGEWVGRKLQELLETVIDNRGKTPPLSANGYPLVEVNALGSNLIKYNKVSKFIDEDTHRNWFRGHVKPGDILFSTVGAIAECSLVCDKNEPVIAQNIIGLRCEKNVSKLFALYLLTVEQNKEKFLKITMGAVQPSIKVSQMVHLRFVLPKIEEQQRIALCLSSLDEIILSQSTKLEALKTHKKGLMQQLFPSPEETEA